VYYERVNPNAPTLTQVIEGLKTWQEQHLPFDRTSQLNLFQFVVEEGKGGALVPFGNNLEEGSHMPTIYLQSNALGQYLTRLQYPQPIYQRLPARLNCLNINWLVQNGNYARDALFRILDENQARALMTDMYQPIDNLDLLMMIEPYLGGGKVRWHFDDQLTFHISISFPEYAEEIKVGDIVERGLHISNSEVGLRSITIAGYLYRLICKNGAIGSGGGDSFRFRHVGDPDRLREKVQAAVESTKLETERITAQFKNALTVQIAQPFEFMEKIAKERALTQEEFKAIMNSYMEAPEDKGNLYGVSQAISNAANLLEGERSYELQRVAVDVSGLTRVD
jgi:hypothetical protein